MYSRCGNARSGRRFRGVALRHPAAQLEIIWRERDRALPGFRGFLQLTRRHPRGAELEQNRRALRIALRQQRHRSFEGRCSLGEMALRHFQPG
jgi:hypothetical protein